MSKPFRMMICIVGSSVGIWAILRHSGLSASECPFRSTDDRLASITINDLEGREYTISKAMARTASEQLFVLDPACPTCSTLLDAMATHGTAGAVLVLLLWEGGSVSPGIPSSEKGYSVFLLDPREAHRMGVESVSWLIDESDGRCRAGPGVAFLYQGRVHLFPLLRSPQVLW